MGQPKAEWNVYQPGCAHAEVGMFFLDVHVMQDGWSDWVVADADDVIAEGGWRGPCDITDLMRLAEAELARRLHGAADSMDGRELVAPVSLRPTVSPLHPVDTSDKTPVGVVEKVNEDGTVLVRVGGAAPTIDEKCKQEIAERVAPAGGLWVDTATNQLMWRDRAGVSVPVHGTPTDGKWNLDGVSLRGDAGLEWVCSFDCCDQAPTHRRGSMSYCDTHAREHDANVVQLALEQAKRDNPVMLGGGMVHCRKCNITVYFNQKCACAAESAIGSREWATRVGATYAYLDMDALPEVPTGWRLLK